MLLVTENQLLYKIQHPTANPEDIVIEIPTHACTESRAPCRNCWFCKERAWAESVLC